ncbi:MAG: type 1 glutamine amidotransferase [Tabrizicola sp.]|nr:type 1 glutamine amidotransferase [Tabrizicola sp.]
MHIAVLVTNTDQSAFAARHPRDAEKFIVLMKGARPDWQITTFEVTENVFPPSLEGFDGLLIGGSPASVNDENHWIERLSGLIRRAHAAGVPMVGVCFGHQAIAQALGGEVGENPGPFVLGTTETTLTTRVPWIPEDARSIILASAHGEQVTALPPGAEVLGESAGCKVAAYRIGTRVFATQHHPEMTPHFHAALVEEFAPMFAPEVGAAARASLTRTTEGPRFAEWIARFFEQA